MTLGLGKPPSTENKVQGSQSRYVDGNIFISGGRRTTGGKLVKKLEERLQVNFS